VTIDMDNITNFSTGMFDLSFESSVMNVKDVTAGSIDETGIPIIMWGSIDDDTIRVMLGLSGVTTVSGAGYLAKISFQVVGEEGEESILNLSNGELVCFLYFLDSKTTPEEITAEWIDAEIRIVKGDPEPMPTPPVNRIHNLNTSKNFSFIQAAIDDTDTKDRHVIEVEDGIYYENVDVTKSLTICSRNGYANCIVQAEWGSDHVFEITANYASISGFTVRRASALNKAGMYLNASHCNVSNNNCSNNHYGVYLENSNNNTVSDNNCFLNIWDGVYLKGSSNNSITNNNCSSHNQWGVNLVHKSDNNVVFDNNCSNNWEGIFIRGDNNTISNNTCFSSNLESGIDLSGSYNDISNNNCYSNNGSGISISGSDNTISNNTCYSNSRSGISISGSNSNILNNNCTHNSDGIRLVYSRNSIVSSNNCFSNDIGICLASSNNNIVSNNNCSSNADYGIVLYLSSNNRIYLNNYINTKNVDSYKTINIWKSTEKITYVYNGSKYENYLGNFWSDYEGKDTNKDGIGDSPYHRDIDNYPLMMPFENYLVSKQIYVPDDYSTIQQAVDNATEGNVIIVRDGTYVENVKVSKRLTIRSENGTDSTIVIAEDSYKNVFEVTANCVNINGFSMEGAKGEAKAGIYLNADHCYISNNNASNCSVGIFLLFADDNTIAGNRAIGNEKDGIYLNNSYKNELERNKLLNNTHGIGLVSSDENRIDGNSIPASQRCGIRIRSSATKVH
jgi:parallel beta-helix repeat protein